MPGELPSETRAALADLWERSRATVEARLVTVERTFASWLDGGLDDQPREIAQREAHRLAGSLSIFEHRRAAQLAYELERLLDPRSGDDPAQARRGAEVLAELRDELERISAERRPQAPRPTESHAQRSVEQPPRILAADDDDMVARVLETALRRDGYDLVRARDGAEAVQVAGRQDFDLILLDVQMPNMDGFTACRALRADPRLASVPIVMLTARGDEDRIAAGIADGASDYLLKPFGVAELRARVKDWLTRRRASCGGVGERAAETGA